MTGDPIEAIRAHHEHLCKIVELPDTHLSPSALRYVSDVGYLLSELDGLRARAKGHALVPDVCLVCGNNWRRAEYPDSGWLVDLECTHCPCRFYGLRRDQKEWNAELEAALAGQPPPVVRTYTGSLEDALAGTPVDVAGSRGVLYIPEELAAPPSAESDAAFLKELEDHMTRPMHVPKCHGLGDPVEGTGGNTETRPWWECRRCKELFTDPSWKPPAAPGDQVKAAGLRGLNALLRPLARWRR